jgi:glycosyltransferase involved in cell wall biosynthesis
MPLTGVKIIIVLPSFALNGAERQAYLLARHLKTHQSADVVLVSIGAPGGIERLCAVAGLRCVFFRLYHRAGNRWTQVLDVMRFIIFLRRERARVVLPYCMFQNVLCGLTWRLGGASVCIWNQRDEGRSRVERWVEQLAVSQIRCFISNSTHGADFLMKSLGAAPSVVHVVPNGVEVPTVILSRDGWRKKLARSPNDFIASMVATLHRFKDHQTLIAAWRLVTDRLRQEGLEAHLLLAGLWEDRYEDLVKQVTALDLKSHVHFLGEVEDVGGLLNCSDVFVFSSFTEGVPNAVLEAMACGLAVIGTEYAGIRQALGDDCALFLATPQNAEDLATKIIAAALDLETRRRLGESGRRRLSEQFSVDRMCERMVELISVPQAR